MRPDGDRLPTVEEIVAFRPQLLRLARGRRWAGDVDDMVQETLAWACAERDSYNPAKGTVGAWLWGMLITVRREHIDRRRAENPKIPEGVSKSTRKYDWPKNLSQQMLETVARPAELAALQAMIEGRADGPSYQRTRLSALRKRISEYAPLWHAVPIEGMPVTLDAICVALRGTGFRLAPRRR